MAVQIGCDGSLSIGTTAIGYIDSWSLTTDHSTSEVTALGDKWKAFIATVKSWNGSANATVLDSTEHKTLIDDLISGADTTLDAVFKAGKEVSFSGKIYVTSASVSATQGDKTSVSFNFQGTGALSVSGMTTATSNNT